VSQGATPAGDPPRPTASVPARLASAAAELTRLGVRGDNRLQRWLDALRARQPRADRQMLAALGIAMVLFSLFPIANFLLGRYAMDYNLWYLTGQNYLHSRPIYPASGPFEFIYPPSAAAMLALPAMLGRPVFILGLIALNSLAWLACSGLTVWLAAGALARQHPLLTLLPSVAMGCWIWDTYLLGQPALVLLALMLGAAASLRHGRPALAGVLIGTAAAIKAYPLLAVIYLVYRRHWRAAGAALLSLGAWLLVVPLAFRPPATAVAEAATWTRQVAFKYGESGISQRGVRSFSFRNQSIMGVANRLLRPVPADGEADPNWKVNVANLGFRAVNAVIAATMLGLAAFYLRSMPRGRPPKAREEALEWAMLLLLIALASPLSFNYGFVWMLYPIGIATQLVLEAAPASRARARAIGWLGVALLVQATALPLRRVAQAYGGPFFSAVILFIGLGTMLGHSHGQSVLVPGSDLANEAR